MTTRRLGGAYFTRVAVLDDELEHLKLVRDSQRPWTIEFTGDGDSLPIKVQ